MAASKLLASVVVVVVSMLIITAYCQQNDERRMPNATSSAFVDLQWIFFEKSSEQLGAFLNNQKESPRQNLNSILQFLGTLSIYIGCVFLLNVRYSRSMFAGDLWAHQQEESVSRKIQDCWALQKAILHPFLSRFRGSLGGIRQRALSVYYLFESENQRAETFLNLKESSPVSILNLARCGFYYMPEHQLVKCFGCGKEMQLKAFNRDPSDRQFHASISCRFVFCVTQSLSHEATGWQQRDETNCNGEKYEPLTKSITEDKASIEQRQTGCMAGDQTDTSSNDSAKTSCRDDFSSKVSEPGDEKVASALQELGDQKVPMVDSRSVREGQEKANSLPNSSSVPEDIESSTNPNTIPDDNESSTNPSTIPGDSESSTNPSTIPDDFESSTNPSTIINDTESRPNQSTIPDDSDESGQRPLSPSSSADASWDLSQQLAVSPACSAGKYCNGTRPKAGTSKETSASNSTEDRREETNDSHLSTEWKDSENFVPECYIISDKKLPEKLDWRDACPKSDVHDSFIPAEMMTKSKLPEDLRCPTLLQLVMYACNLTVKLECKATSRARPEGDAHRRKHGTAKTSRCGTGFVILDSDKDRAKELINLKKESLPSSKTKKAKHFLCQSVGKTTKCYFSVETSKHLVFDNTEAKHTEVLFGFQDAKNRNVKKFTGKGVLVIHDQVDGNYKSTLLCQSSDSNLLAVLDQERRHFQTLTQKLSPEVKKQLLESCFVISHPHGQNKMVTFGECTILKYALDPDKRQFERHIKRGKESPVEDIREVLLYTAGTCNGSSGAAVFSCRNIRRQPGEDSQLQLTVWTHNGVEKESGLNCTVMNSYKPELTESTKPSLRTITSSPAPTSPTGSGAAETTPALGPKAPKFVAMESRLQSFKKGYESQCKHSPVELAEAGFYFTGKEDCVRCFCCGLGLKNWRPENQIHEEHESRVPDCSFLKAHKDSKKQVEPALLFDESDKTCESLRVSLLKSERKKLASKFICKVCWKHPACELFLSCGDVFACERCANLLFTCPLCSKPIYATVTAYLS